VDDIIAEWASVKPPAAPELKPVTVDPKTTALLVPRLHEGELRSPAALPEMKSGCAGCTERSSSSPGPRRGLGRSRLRPSQLRAPGLSSSPARSGRSGCRRWRGCVTAAATRARRAPLALRPLQRRGLSAAPPRPTAAPARQPVPLPLQPVPQSSAPPPARNAGIAVAAAYAGALREAYRRSQTHKILQACQPQAFLP
jgi:hypothetical protein